MATDGRILRFGKVGTQHKNTRAQGASRGPPKMPNLFADHITQFQPSSHDIPATPPCLGWHVHVPSPIPHPRNYVMLLSGRFTRDVSPAYTCLVTILWHKESLAPAPPPVVKLTEQSPNRGKSRLSFRKTGPLTVFWTRETGPIREGKKWLKWRKYFCFCIHSQRKGSCI